MILEAIAVTAMLCALTPAVLFCLNLRLYRAPGPPDPRSPSALPFVSLLIPARDEALSIAAALTSALTTTGIAFEIVVMDDCSTDLTAPIVRSIAAADTRVRLEHAPPLPAGWNGKQHACWALAHAARGDLLCFVDADVRLAPHALSHMASFLIRQRAALVSGFPRQLTGTWMEWMLLPLIHFILLGFLPIDRMRSGTDPSFAAGCGQFLMVQREAYFAAGGHAAIRKTMHDGLLLPRLLRHAGYRTDLADLTALATCRMYTNARQVWQGLAKNATEGLADPVRIVPISLLLLLGQVMPFALVIAALWAAAPSTAITVFALLGIASAWLPRVLGLLRFHQDWRGALLHPFAIILLLAVQWFALTRRLFGGAVSWKQRSYAGE